MIKVKFWLEQGINIDVKYHTDDIDVVIEEINNAIQDNGWIVSGKTWINIEQVKYIVFE